MPRSPSLASSGPLAGLLAGPLVALALGACASQVPEFGEGRGFGLVPSVESRPASFASQAWGIKLALATDVADMSESAESWIVTNAQRVAPDSGQFTLMVLRNAKIDGQAPADVARLLRDGEVERGGNAGEIAAAQFLGRPGAVFMSSPGDDLFSVTVLTVVDKCVYVLSVTRSGDQDDAAAYAADLLDDISTFDGGPADAPACR